MFKFECTIENSWVDYNGHLRDAYYGLIFSFAVDHFMLDIGMDEHYRDTTGGTLYVVEDHRYYLREIHADARARVESSVLDNDSKRILLMQHLYTDTGSNPCAVCESMQMHVVQHPEPAAAAMPESIIKCLEAARTQCSNFRSRALGIKRA